MAKIGCEYFYKGNKYVVKGFSRMKNPMTGEWDDAVNYQRVGDDNLHRNEYVRIEEDFDDLFTIANLVEGDTIYAISDNKVLKIFQISSIDAIGKVTAETYNGIKLKCYRGVSSDGTAKVISCAWNYDRDKVKFYVNGFGKIQRRIDNGKKLKYIVAYLKDVSDRIMRIDTACNSDSICKLKEDILKTFEQCLKKFKV